MSLAIDIAREAGDWPVVEALIEAAVAATLATARPKHREGAELSVVLTDDAAIRALNASWRDKDKPTNVLSFPAAEGARVATAPMLGDIVLALETIRREAVDEGVPFEDHLAHLVVHGLLHLFGHDHLTDEEAGRMEALESRVMLALGRPDPWA